MRNILVLDFNMMVFLSIFDPDLLEDFKILLELRDRTVFRNIVVFELLDDNEHEQVKHDALNYQYKHEKVDCRIFATTCMFTTVRP